MVYCHVHCANDTGLFSSEMLFPSILPRYLFMWERHILIHNTARFHNVREFDDLWCWIRLLLLFPGVVSVGGVLCMNRH